MREFLYIFGGLLFLFGAAGAVETMPPNAGWWEWMLAIGLGVFGGMLMLRSVR